MRQWLSACWVVLCSSAVCAAELPETAVLNFKGSYGIPAEMTFKRNGDNYTVNASINVPLYKIRFESGGKIVNGNQLYPSYYRDKRNGKIYASAVFSGGKVTYGKAGEQKTDNVSGRVMDLFTLSWQMAFDNGRLPEPLHITNGKKIYPAGSVGKMGNGDTVIGGKTVQLNQFTVKRGDDSLYYAFAPDWGNIPTVIHYVDNGKRYVLNLRRAVVNGQEVTR